MGLQGREGSPARPVLSSSPSANRAQMPACVGLWEAAQPSGEATRKACQQVNLTTVAASLHRSVFTQEAHQRWSEGDLRELWWSVGPL